MAVSALVGKLHRAGPAVNVPSHQRPFESEKAASRVLGDYE